MASLLNLTLVGFLRGDDCVIYSHPERLLGKPDQGPGERVSSLTEKIA